MSKSILVSLSGRPFGVFSNKTNAWLSIKGNLDESDLRVLNEKRQEFSQATYSNVTTTLSKKADGKHSSCCKLYSQKLIDEQRTQMDEAERIQKENTERQAQWNLEASVNGSNAEMIKTAITAPLLKDVPEVKKLVPVAYLYQYETNVADNGVVYKSAGDKED